MFFPTPGTRNLHAVGDVAEDGRLDIVALVAVACCRRATRTERRSDGPQADSSSRCTVNTAYYQANANKVH